MDAEKSKAYLTGQQEDSTRSMLDDRERYATPIVGGEHDGPLTFRSSPPGSGHKDLSEATDSCPSSADDWDFSMKMGYKRHASPRPPSVIPKISKEDRTASGLQKLKTLKELYSQQAALQQAGAKKLQSAQSPTPPRPVSQGRRNKLKKKRDESSTSDLMQHLHSSEMGRVLFFPCTACAYPKDGPQPSNQSLLRRVREGDHGGPPDRQSSLLSFMSASTEEPSETPYGHMVPKGASFNSAGSMSQNSILMGLGEGGASDMSSSGTGQINPYEDYAVQPRICNVPAVAAHDETTRHHGEGRSSPSHRGPPDDMVNTSVSSSNDSLSLEEELLNIQRLRDLAKLSQDETDIVFDRYSPPRAKVKPEAKSKEKKSKKKENRSNHKPDKEFESWLEDGEASVSSSVMAALNANQVSDEEHGGAASVPSHSTSSRIRRSSHRSRTSSTSSSGGSGRRNTFSAPRRLRRQPTSNRVRFEYPPVTSLRQRPRYSAEERSRLFFTEEELDEIDSDRRARRPGDDVEIIATVRDEPFPEDVFMEEDDAFSNDELSLERPTTRGAEEEKDEDELGACAEEAAEQEEENEVLPSRSPTPDSNLQISVTFNKKKGRRRRSKSKKKTTKEKDNADVTTKDKFVPLGESGSNSSSTSLNYAEI